MFLIFYHKASCIIYFWRHSNIQDPRY